MKNLRVMFLALVAAALLAPAGAWATSVTASMPVTATVTPYATINVTPLDFGSFRDAHQSTATVTVNVSSGASYHISMDAGQHHDNTGRKMVDGSQDVLSYILYQDSNQTVQWGDSDTFGTYLGGTSEAGTGTGADQTLTVYGWSGVTPGATLAGSYSDTVTVTVSY